MRLRRFRIGVMCTALAGCWLVSTAMTPSAFADPGHIPAPRGPLILAEKGIGPAPGHSLYDLVQSVISGELGWNPTAVNPSSGAFGLFQFNPSWGTLQEYLPSRSPAPYIQALAGMAYIKARYGSPSAAWAFWNKHWPHWYLQGGAVRDVGPKPPLYPPLSASELVFICREWVAGKSKTEIAEEIYEMDPRYAGQLWEANLAVEDAIYQFPSGKCDPGFPAPWGNSPF